MSDGGRKRDHELLSIVVDGVDRRPNRRFNEAQSGVEIVSSVAATSTRELTRSIVHRYLVTSSFSFVRVKLRKVP